MIKYFLIILSLIFFSGCVDSYLSFNESNISNSTIDKTIEYNPTTIKDIRTNSDKYINTNVSISKHYSPSFGRWSHYFEKQFNLKDSDGYLIYINNMTPYFEQPIVESKLTSKGNHVTPSYSPSILIIEGKVIYDEYEMVKFEPHKIINTIKDGDNFLVWEFDVIQALEEQQIRQKNKENFNKIKEQSGIDDLHSPKPIPTPEQPTHINGIPVLYPE